MANDVRQESHSIDNNRLTISMVTPDPFSLSETLLYLSRSPHECLFRVENHKVVRLLQVNGEFIVVEISGTDNTLQVSFFGPNAGDESVRHSLTAYVADWFDLNRELTEFYDQMEHCPLLRRLTHEHRGLRVIGVPDLFEAMCWAIIGQQINLGFAYTLKRRFVEAFGESHVHGDNKLYVFPRPERVAELQPEDLLKLQFTKMKSEYIIDVARRMAAGTLSKANLLALGDFRAAERELVKIRGIGPWTANYVLMRCLRDKSPFPIQDVGLHNAVKGLLGQSVKPTLHELRELAKKWSGWEAYATFYLWRSL